MKTLRQIREATKLDMKPRKSTNMGKSIMGGTPKGTDHQDLFIAKGMDSIQYDEQEYWDFEKYVNKEYGKPGIYGKWNNDMAWIYHPFDDYEDWPIGLAMKKDVYNKISGDKKYKKLLKPLQS